MLTPTADQPCPRCGTFAPLVTNEWRTVCAPCQRLLAHPVEATEPTFVSLWWGAWLVFRDNWLLALGICALIALPSIVALLAGVELPPALDLTLMIVLITLGECFVLATAAQRAFTGSTSWTASSDLVFARFWPVMVFNLLTGLLVAISVVTCVGPAFVTAWALPGIPIVMFERKTAGEALKACWVRSRRVTWPLLTLALLTIALGSTTLVATFAAEAVSWAAGGGSTKATLGLRLLAELIDIPSNAFVFLAQIAAWQATRPRAAT